MALVPDPAYPGVLGLHSVLVGADVRYMPLTAAERLPPRSGRHPPETGPPGQAHVHQLPQQPHGRHRGGGRDFFERVVDVRARNTTSPWCTTTPTPSSRFDGYVAPSFLATPGAKDIGVEFFSFSKPFNMTGWRVGFAVGNRQILQHLWRLKTNLDSGSVRGHPAHRRVHPQRPLGLRRTR